MLVWFYTFANYCSSLPEIKEQPAATFQTIVEREEIKAENKLVKTVFSLYFNSIFILLTRTKMMEALYIGQAFTLTCQDIAVRL